MMRSRVLPVYLRASVWGGIVLLVASLALAQEPSAILVDASGSMQGFFAEETIHDLYQKIAGAIEGQKYAYYFRFRRADGEITGGLEPYDVPARTDRSITLIDRGYQAVWQRHTHLAAMWLVTDNIQDPQGHLEEQGDINRFYDELKQDRVKRVHIFPTTMHFNGMIYGRDGYTKVGPYAGPRGVIIYAMLFDEDQEDAFSRSLRHFAVRLGEKGILAKPLDAVVLEGDKKAVEQELISAPGSRRSRHHLHPQRDQEGKVIALASQEVFSSGEQMEGEFHVRFRSHLESVSIAYPEVTVTLDEPCQLAGLSTTEPKMYADPLRLEHVLQPDKHSSDIKVRVIFPQGVTLNPTAECSWQASKPGSYRGSINVGLKIKKNQLSLADEIRTKYSTVDPDYFTSLSQAYQTRIYGLEKLFREASREEIITSRQSYPIIFHVACPVPWVALWAVGFVVVLLVLGWLLWWVLGRSPNYRLANLGGGELRCTPLSRQK